ncbi:hypothetical protein E2C01_102163 [Portunus trituberculatus]|uniref:Uncharacterized protein n=1 Tax=Portunus trituberculatus TaxID=210409 RepID=A0A5B7KHQ8_PORTR|nr:hypothetical protein [Portunus trituberculatus]
MFCSAPSPPVLLSPGRTVADPRWQTLRLSPTSSRSTLPVSPGRILQPQAYITAREWNLSA